MEKVRELFNPKFTCNGVTLSLSEIQTRKHIKTLLILYILENNWIETIYENILQTFNKDYKFAKYITETISNPDIILHFNEDGDHGMIISFSSEIEYSRILNYNSTSIYLKKEGNKIKCYKIFSKLKYLVGISWDERI